MLAYNTLKDKAKEFLAVTGLKSEEFARLLPAFESGYRPLYPADKTAEGKTRRRQPGGGAKGVLQNFEDKLLFIGVWGATEPGTQLSLLVGANRKNKAHFFRRFIYPPGDCLPWAAAWSGGCGEVGAAVGVRLDTGGRGRIGVL